MAEPLKNVYSLAHLNELSDVVNQHHASFDKQSFLSHTINSDEWSDLALKARMQRVATSLYDAINLPFPEVLNILIPSSNYFGGGELGDFVSIYFPEIVSIYGLEYFNASMDALAHFTTRSTGEFAIRSFIIAYPEKTMQQMLEWANDDNEKVRRLASEGCRPRLPWGISLPPFKANPEPILPILHTLKNDPSLFVRRSVANNLNDIAKDNPAIAIKIFQDWYGYSKDTDWLVKHASRSLLKQSNPEVLTLFGFNSIEHIHLNEINHNQEVNWGGQLDFNFRLKSSKPLGKLRLEYVIGFMKSNGKCADKVFQISEIEENGHTLFREKKHSFKAISTRKYYAGNHRFALHINGQRVYEGQFALKAPDLTAINE